MKKRERLARMIAEYLGVPLDGIELYPAEGYWRSSPQADVMRWEGWFVNQLGVRFGIDSWDTMTDSVRYGIEIERDGPRYLVAAKGNQPKKASKP